MRITAAMPVHNAALSTVVAAYQVLDNLFCCEAEWQLLLIDDHSSLMSGLILEQLGQLPGIRLVHTQDYITTPNPNLGWNVNWALDQVTPEDDFFFHVESDVYLEPFCLKNLIAEIGDSGMAIPQFFSVCKRLSTHSFPGCEPNVPIEREDSTKRLVKWAHLGCMLIRGDVARDRSIRIEADKFRLWYADFDLCATFKSRGHTIQYVPTAHTRHRGNMSSHSAPAGGPRWDGIMNQEEARLYVESKWGRDCFE